MNVKEFLRGKPIAVVLCCTAFVSVAAIALTILLGLFSAENNTYDDTGDKMQQTAQTTDTYANADSFADVTLPLPDETQETTAGLTTQQSTTVAKTKPAVATRVKITGEFKNLGIKKQKLSHMIFATHNSEMWHSGTIKGNNNLSYGLAEYLRFFSSDFGLINDSVWYDAPKAVDSTLKTSGLRCTGALSIDMFNRIIADLYGPSTPTLSYSDFPSVSSGNKIWKIMHADSSYGIGECLVLVDNLSGVEFENNSGTIGEYVGFSVKNGLISAIYVSLYDYNNRPAAVLVSEVYFAKDSNNNYYMHSVNPDRFETGESDVFDVDELNDYDFYEIFTGNYEPHKLSYYLPEYLKAEKSTTAAPTAPPTTAAPQKLTMEQAYSQVISTISSDPDMEYASGFQYCLFDIDKNGTQELIISGKESVGWYFTNIYAYNSSTGKAEKAGNLYHYGEIRYSPKLSMIEITEEKPTVYYYESQFFKLSGNKLLLEQKIGADSSDGENFKYYLTDSSGKTVEIDSDEKYFSDLITLQMVEI